jgi:hypothetical protein
MELCFTDLRFDPKNGFVYCDFLIRSEIEDFKIRTKELLHEHKSVDETKKNLIKLIEFKIANDLAHNFEKDMNLIVKEFVDSVNIDKVFINI